MTQYNNYNLILCPTLVSLTKTTKTGKKLKQSIMENLREAVEKYENIFVFQTDNMRNGKLKDVRNEWKDSR